MIMAFIVMAYAVMAYGVMAYTVMAYSGSLSDLEVPCLGVDLEVVHVVPVRSDRRARRPLFRRVRRSISPLRVDLACIVMAYIVMAYIVMA